MAYYRQASGLAAAKNPPSGFDLQAAKQGAGFNKFLNPVRPFPRRQTQR
jgi:hypothetical protein